MSDKPKGDKPKVGRVQVWIDCVCGAEVEIEDAEHSGMTYESLDCEDCGKIITVLVDVMVTHHGSS